MKYFLAALFIFSLLLVIPHETLAASSVGLVKGSQSAVFYVTADGKRWAFPDEATYFSWYKNFRDVKIVSDDVIFALPLAGSITFRPGKNPVRFKLDDKVYAVAAGGVLRHISTPSLAAMIFGSGWQKKTVALPATIFSAYEVGNSITSAGQYWWKREMEQAPDIVSDLALRSGIVSQSLGFTTVPKTTSHKTINLAVGLWDPYPNGNASTPKKSTIEEMIFTGTKSVRGYFKEMSGGSVTMENAGIFGWYKADKPVEHYWSNPDPTDADGDGYVSGHNEKWAETIKKMDKDMDFASYDANHDGILSSDELGILIVIPSDGPFGTNRVVYAQESPSLKPMVVDGVQIGMIAEWYTGNPPNFGAPAHELSHLFFNTADMYLDSNYRAGSLSLMDGSYCNCDIDPWQRLANGKNWLNTLLPKGSGYYELAPIGTSDSVMKITRPGSDEFFLVEYRDHDAYNNTGTPGLLVWDIRTDSTSGDWGRDNIRLLRANGGKPLDDNQAAYHGSSGAPVSTGVLHWFDGSASGITLSDIGKPGATIRFKYNSSP